MAPVNQTPPTPKQNAYLAEAEEKLREAQAAAVAATEAADEAKAAAAHIGRRLPMPQPVKMIIGAAPPARGTPRKFTLERQRQYLDAVARGVTRSDAAKAAGVSVQAVHSLRRKDPDFLAAEQEAEQLACDLVEEALFDAARQGNVEAIKVWLFNRNPARWQPIQKLQVQVSGSVEVVDVVSALAEIQQLEQALQARVLRNVETPALGAGADEDAEVVED